MHRLVKCWNHTSPEIVNAALSQLRSCSNWKVWRNGFYSMSYVPAYDMDIHKPHPLQLRLSAVQLLEAIGVYTFDM